MENNHPHHCKEIAKQISEYLDGELKGQYLEALENHLDGCTDCQNVVHSMKKTIELFQIVEENDSIPEDVRQRLFRCLELDDESPKSE